MSDSTTPSPIADAHVSTAPATPPPAAAAPTNMAEPTQPEITFDDFAKVDLRVAKVLEARPHPNADKLLVLKVDVGDPEPRQICAGVKAYYSAESLVGKLIVIVKNLAPRKLRGETSQGMLLAASGPDKASVVLVCPMTDIAPGSKVS